MTFSPERILKRLDELETAENAPARYIIALSGGLDSRIVAASSRPHGRKVRTGSGPE